VSTQNFSAVELSQSLFERIKEKSLNLSPQHNPPFPRSTVKPQNQTHFCGKVIAKLKQTEFVGEQVA